MKRYVIAFTLVAAVACDHNSEDTAKPGTVAAEPEVAQEPDPPEIARAAHEYVLGHYDETITILEPLYASLKERSQYRASGLAGGWLAMAHAQGVFENGQEPSRHAMAMADKTLDPEVVAVAQLASGSMLMGNEDFVGAKRAFDNAAKAAPGSLQGALANTLRAESLIGTAFGSADSETVENPADLEAAKAAYAQTAKTADSGIETDVLKGRVEEGLAAIARYQRDQEGVCEHTKAAVAHFKAAQASDFLLDGPSLLAADFKCEWLALADGDAGAEPSAPETPEE